MININTQNLNPQGSPLPQGAIAVQPPQPPQMPQMTQPQQPQQPQQAMGQPQLGSIPQYITLDQYKQMAKAAQQQGLDPNQLAQTLVSNGYIIQGLNDQQYQYQQIAQGNLGSLPAQQPRDSLLGKIGSGILGLGKSLIQPLVSGAGSLVRSLQATPDLFTGNLARANQVMQEPIFGEKTLQGMNNEEALGTAAKAASFLAPLVPGGVLVEGAVGGALQGGGQAAVENKSTDEVTGEATLGALGGAATAGVLSKVLPKVAPLLFRTAESGGAQDVALNAYETGRGDINGFQKAFQQEFVNGAKAIDEALPQSKVNLDVPELQELQQTAKTYGVKLPSSVKVDLTSEGGTMEGVDLSKLKGMPIAELNAQDTQSLLTELGKKRMSAGVVNGPVENMISTLHDKATQAFGEDFNQLYSNYAKNAEALKSVNDLFGDANKTQTASEVASNIKTISDLANDKQGKVVLQNTLRNFKQATGIDLTNSAKAIAAANKVKNPLAKKLLLGGLGMLGLGKAGELVKTGVEHFMQ